MEGFDVRRKKEEGRDSDVRWKREEGRCKKEDVRCCHPDSCLHSILASMQQVFSPT